MAIGMGLGISIYFSRKITNPLKALSRAASNVAEGDLDQTVEEAAGDEVGELITAFNKMVNDLKTSRDQVEKYNWELQAMVEERTTELEKTKEYLENILEYSGDMIITTTLFDEIVQFNSGAETLLGYKKERMVGINIDTLFANKSDYRKLREKVVAGDEVSSYETKLMQRSGDIIDVSLTFSQLRDRSDEIIGLVGIGRNITEKKKLEDEQKKYADRLLKEIEDSAKAAQTSEKKDNNSDENR
jgi:PAS domain S-box-containing protein